MPCPRTHLNNVPRMRGEKNDISLKMHQAGFETARQAATSAERHALTIAPCPSPHEAGLLCMVEINELMEFYPAKQNYIQMICVLWVCHLMNI